MEAATFLPADPTPLVEASLSCPFCLAGADHVVIEGGVLDASARCSCTACSRERSVALDPEQFLRLSLTVLRTG
jgi:hypothetical protein